MNAKLVAIPAVLLFALAGCGTKDPTGKLENANFATPLAASIDLFYQPFTNGGNPLPTQGPVNATCLQNTPSAPADPSGSVHRCKGPYTTIKVSAENLPAPNGATYAVILVGPGRAPYNIGPLDASQPNATISINATADLSGAFDHAELRLDDFLYGTAPVGSGKATAAGMAASGKFTLSAGVNALTVVGGFTGNSFDVTVAGLPATNGTYTGMLYLPNPDGTVASTPTEMFPIRMDGVYHFEPKAHQISEYAQFHIHFEQSKLNLYKANIVQDAA
ncbi:MAG: hypothetical protein V4510_02740 [bacterium]